ncbi:transcription termination factor NusA [Mesoplasma photuris]|uniref:transcription termination factor NusA n=1 Tax=Mesoplasma photuris TaxID=217731 RepID=UPI0004E0EF3B|nr:transcription termination factor NusA [Mesoplasma photuris]
MVNGAQLLEAINLIASEKNIEKELVIEAIKEGFAKAYERFFDTEAWVEVEIDEKVGSIEMFQVLTVVKTVEDDWLEISVNDANKEFVQEHQIGDQVRRKIEFNTEFSKSAVGQVAQIINQKIRGAERAKVYDKYIGKKGEIIRGKIIGINEQQTSYLVDLDGTTASLWHKKTINGETFNVNEYVTLFIEEVERDNKFSQVMVSRTAADFLGKLLEENVPEIFDGIIEVKAVSREPGKRAKVAVMSHDEFVDPIGSVVGSHGVRINSISKELKGEKIDVVKWDENVIQFVMNAMAPVRVISVSYNEEDGECDVIVPNEQLSLAIGKSGIAARLVANLLKLRVNIFSYENAITDGIEILWNGNITEAELSDPEFLANVNRRKEKSTTPRVERPKFNRRNDFDVDALAAAQADILLDNEIEEEYEEIDFEELEIEAPKPLFEESTLELSDIEAELEALDEETDSDLFDEDLEEYDEYYK